MKKYYKFELDMGIMYNMSEIFKKAWNIVKNNGKTMSEALKAAWEWAKATVSAAEKRYQIKDWFMNKNLDKVTSAHMRCIQFFGKENIIKETEKALYVELEMITNFGADTKYTRKIWVPKSCVEEYNA